MQHSTCAPQNIRFPTDASLLNEARQKAEEIIDILHENGLIDGRKPRDYRVKALRKYNSFSKARKKTTKMIRDVIRQQLGFLRIEDLRWDAYNECTTFQESVEAYKRSYGHYPQRILADTIFRTRGNMKYCKERGIHLNGPKLGKPYSDPAIQKQQKKLE